MDDLSFYNPEGSELRKAQMKMLEILDVIDGICTNHGINYWLISGTLLGARRHGGFIPWDDDLDIAVLQKDYSKLLSVLKEELPEGFKLQTRKTDERYWFYFAKVRNADFRYKVGSQDNFVYKGAYLDLFSIEPVPSIQFKKAIDKILFSAIHLKKAKTLYHKIKYGIMSCFIPVMHFIIKLSRAYYKYISNSKAYTYSYGIFFYSNYNIEYFLPPSEIEFEGKRYKAPNNVDKYLTDKYGADFMQVPKPADRKTHTVRAEFL